VFTLQSLHAGAMLGFRMLCRITFETQMLSMGIKLYNSCNFMSRDGIGEKLCSSIARWSST